MIVAIRNLTLSLGADEEKAGISIYAPEVLDDTWVCRYEIEWPGQTRASFAAGVDSVQAIHLALQKIGMELYVSPYHLSGALKWENSGDGYGFPVPKNGRDLLVGSDKIFEG